MVDQPNMGNAELEALLMPPCFIHKTMKLPAVMTQLRSQKMHLAIVVDEYGGTMGMVTLEDAVEQFKNAYSPIDTKFAGRTTLVTLEQDANALEAIVFVPAATFTAPE